MGYELRNNLDKGYIRFIKVSSTEQSLEGLLDKFNINLDDYWILKSSNRYRFIDIDELYNYAGIICFRKDIFKKGDIEEWIEFIYDMLGLGGHMKYLVKPFPDISLMDKIRVIEWDIE